MSSVIYVIYVGWAAFEIILFDVILMFNRDYVGTVYIKIKFIPYLWMYTPPPSTNFIQVHSVVSEMYADRQALCIHFMQIM
jgi:hypothetical protein